MPSRNAPTVERTVANARTVARSLSTVDEIATRLPPLKVVERIGFRDRFAGERCARVGGKQSPLSLLRDATAVIVAVERTHRAFPGELLGFSLKRVAWLCECTNELARVLEAETHAEGTKGAAKALRAREVRKARVARTLLHDVLSEVLGCDDRDEAEALSRAVGDASSDEALASSLNALIKVSQEWLERPDAAWMVRVTDAGLTDALVERARGAVATLTTSGRHAVRTKKMRDAIAGRVALEVAAATRAVARAHSLNLAVQLLEEPSSARRAA